MPWLNEAVFCSRNDPRKLMPSPAKPSVLTWPLWSDEPDWTAHCATFYGLFIDNTPLLHWAANLRALVRPTSNGYFRGGNLQHEQYTAVSERLLGVVFGVAAQIVEEDICSMEDVDRGAKVGLRWARGPFEMMNRIGVAEACRMAAAYAETAGEGWKVPAFFAQQGTTPWDFSYVDTTVNDGVATITINRPEAMNALNVTVVGQLTQAVAAANANDEIHTIVVDGAGKAFVAGADVKFFVDKIRADAIPDIYDFTAEGHELLNMLELTIALTTDLRWAEA